MSKLGVTKEKVYLGVEENTEENHPEVGQNTKEKVYLSSKEECK